jgi:membrane protein implicated in regulation of membrane protease activity
MSWWVWVLFGIILLVIEMLTPGGLFALFFGVGALCVAGLAALGAPPILQWVAFTVVSVVLLATLRRWVQEKLLRAPSTPIDAIVGQEVVLLDDLAAGGEAKAELRGVPWAARIASGISLRKGQRARVERVDGLTLWVRAD